MKGQRPRANIARPKHTRAEEILIRRCRTGDVEALELLAYRLAPSLWNAVGDMPRRDAVDTCIEGWRAVLRGLSAWHAPTVGHLERRALAAMGCRRPSTEQNGPPSELIAAMLAENKSAAPQLAEAAQRRRFWLLQGYALIAALVLGGLMMFATYQSMDRFSAVSALQLSTLQFRIKHAALSTKLRDISWDLPTTSQGHSPTVRLLESAALALDEIASTPPLRADRLRYVAWRISGADLPSALRDIAQRLPSGKRGPVFDAALALEEVEVWYQAR